MTRAKGLGSMARRAPPPRGGESACRVAMRILRTKAGLPTPGSGNRNFVICITLGSVTGAKGLGGNKRLTEIVEMKVTGVPAPMSNTVPRKGLDNDTASPAAGRVVITAEGGMDLTLSFVLASGVAGGLTSTSIDLNRLLLNFL